MRKFEKSGVPVSRILLSARGIALRNAVVDGSGNTIVGGGVSVSPAASVTSGFIAKFGPQGRKLWEEYIGTNALNGIDALDADCQGNIFITVRLDPFSAHPTLALIKFSSEGHELWRVHEDSVIQNSEPNGIASALKVNAAGNPIMTALIAQDIDAQTRVTEQIVATFDTQGKNIWRTVLPGYSYFLYQGPGTKILALNQSGAISVAGMYSGTATSSDVTGLRGFVATLDANGRLESWTDDYRGAHKPLFYASAVVNDKGILAAAGAGQGATFFSDKGRAVHTDTDGDRILDVTANRGFLLICRGYLCAVNSTGSHEQWRFGYRFGSFWGAVPASTSGWIVGGGNSSGIGFVKINEDGHELWRTELPDYGVLNDPIGYSFQNLLIRAPDGSLRVVARLRGFDSYYSPGIAVAAFVTE